MGLLIKLNNGDTSLKSLKFGNDRPGGGNSGQPFIQKPIGDQAEFTNIDGDGILRGGIRAPLSAGDDVSRLTKYLFNFKSPSGFLFTAKQNILSRVGVKTESSKGIAYVGSALNEGIYTPFSTIGQAGEGYIGGHLTKQGLDPTGAFPNASLKKYQDVIKSNQLIGNIDLANNRLIRLTQLIENKESETNFGFVKGYGLNIGENLISYSGGPGSTLGVDNTNIKFATDNSNVPIKSILNQFKDYPTGVIESQINRDKFIAPIKASESYIFLSPDGVRDFQRIDSNPSTQNNLTKEGRTSFEYETPNRIYTTTETGQPTLNIDQNSNAINPIRVNQVRARVAYSREFERENKWIKPIGVSEAYNIAIGNGKSPLSTPVKFDIDYSDNPQGVHKYFDSWQSSATSKGVYTKIGSQGDSVNDPTLRVRNEVKKGTYLVGKNYSAVEEGKNHWIEPSSSKKDTPSSFSPYPQDIKYFKSGKGKNEIIEKPLTFGINQNTIKSPDFKPKQEISRRISPLSKKSGLISRLQPRGEQLISYNTDLSQINITSVSNLDGTDSYEPNLLLSDQFRDPESGEYLDLSEFNKKVESQLRNSPAGNTPTSSSFSTGLDIFKTLDEKDKDLVNNDGNPSYTLPSEGYSPQLQNEISSIPSIRATPVYRPKTQDDRFSSVRQEVRIGIGDPGATKGNVKQIIDKLNAKPISINQSTGEGPFQESENANDFCHFRIGIVDTQNPTTSNYMNFRAFLEDISDSYSSNWKGESYLGRAEKLYKYSGFDRDMSVSFKVVAQSQAEMNSMYSKLNYLASSMAPTYTPEGYMAGNIVVITIGEYIYEQYAIINSLNYKIPEESPWEITIGQGSNLDELPHYIDVSLKFKPLHNFRPETGPSDAPNLNRFITHNMDIGTPVAYDQITPSPDVPFVDSNETVLDAVPNAAEELSNEQLLELAKQNPNQFFF
jgi:hypothetical protein